MVFEIDDEGPHTDNPLEGLTIEEYLKKHADENKVCYVSNDVAVEIIKNIEIKNWEVVGGQTDDDIGIYLGYKIKARSWPICSQKT
jgi:hypothetical protein